MPRPISAARSNGARNIITHSTTKFIGGHGTSIGGIIVDGGNFDWAATARFANFHHARSFAITDWSIATPAAGCRRLSLKARVQVLRDIGACQSPFNSWQLLQGLETLSLRMERHVQNAQAVAEYLEAHPKVSWVKYPGLKSHPDYARAKKYLPKGAGAILGFGIKGGAEAGQASSSKACSSSATWPTWAMPRAWPSIRPPPPTAS